jgi:Zn-dependent protease with chaperone function
MNKRWWQSNTIRLGLATILGAAAAYLSGQVDATGAAALVVTSALQILQREFSLKKEAEAAPTLIDAGPPEALKGPGA